MYNNIKILLSFVCYTLKLYYSSNIIGSYRLIFYCLKNVFFQQNDYLFYTISLCILR